MIPREAECFLLFFVRSREKKKKTGGKQKRACQKYLEYPNAVILSTFDAIYSSWWNPFFSPSLSHSFFTRKKCPPPEHTPEIRQINNKKQKLKSTSNTSSALVLQQDKPLRKIIHVSHSPFPPSSLSLYIYIHQSIYQKKDINLTGYEVRIRIPNFLRHIPHPTPLIMDIVFAFHNIVLIRCNGSKVVNCFAVQFFIASGRR